MTVETLAGEDRMKAADRALMFDIWLALGGEADEFERWIAHPNRYPSDAWSQLMAAIRRDRKALEADTHPPADQLLDLVPKGTDGT